MSFKAKSGILGLLFLLSLIFFITSCTNSESSIVNAQKEDGEKVIGKRSSLDLCKTKEDSTVVTQSLEKNDVG